jgi:anti-sigma factor RsiW
MPDCSEIGLMLGAAGDGELEPDHLQEVARHVTGCASCTGTLSDYSRIGGELRAVAVMPSLEGFTKSVLELIAKLGVAAIIVVALHSAIVGRRRAEIARPLPAAVASRTQAPGAGRADRLVDVQVDSATVSDSAFGAFSHSNGRTRSGKLIVFSLPGGRTLHVMPRSIDGGVIAMQVVLFEGRQPAMTANLTLESGDTFALSGEQFGETLLLRISPTTTASRGPSYSERSPDAGIHRAS